MITNETSIAPDDLMGMEITDVLKMTGIAMKRLVERADHPADTPEDTVVAEAARADEALCLAAGVVIRARAGEILSLCRQRNITGCDEELVRTRTFEAALALCKCMGLVDGI
ncbi:MAG: hypothetical protein ACE15C_14825 [Phycisphaerae bacterium]